jgi:site-specific DNA-cytosine methylase
MKVLSLFDGMSCGQIALDRAGIEVDNYYSSELDKYAIAVTQANYPDTIQLGDVTKWKEWDIDWASIDLLIGGSPCQGFSLVGKQLAFDDPRSALFFIYMEILCHIEDLNPNVKFLLENVKMKKEHMDVITEYTAVEPVFINSELLSAQSRPRWYWSNFIWRDVVYASDCEECPGCGEPVCNPHNEHYSDCKCIGPGEEDDVVFSEDGTEAFRMPVDLGIDYTSIVEESDKVFLPATVRKGDPRPINLTGDKFLCLTATYYKGIRADGRPALSTRTGVFEELRDSGDCRILTPVECERLQTVPDNYTNHVSNTQRYKMLGNGWTVDVIAHIFEGLRK